MTANIKCDEIGAAFAIAPACEDMGHSLRFETHCLYPGFSPVTVFVVRTAKGIVINDGGGAALIAWEHSRDQSAVSRALNREAALHHLDVNDNVLSVQVESDDWLAQAILSVANASASAARAIVDTAQPANERALHDMIVRALHEIVRPGSIVSNYKLRGKSGKTHNFDIVVEQPKGLTLIDTVSPHHVSIASKYVAFSDTNELGADVWGRFLFYDKPLNIDDVALLNQCADVVPATALRPRLGAHFAMLH